MLLSLKKRDEDIKYTISTQIIHITIHTNTHRKYHKPVSMLLFTFNGPFYRIIFVFIYVVNYIKINILILASL